MDRLAVSKFCVSLLVLFAVRGLAAPPTPAPDPALDVYAKADQLVDIGGGRHLNLRCSGTGAQTVILEAGSTADALSWRKVQPRIARFARVCSYDRAGLGFSDEGPLPRNVDAAVADLHALLLAAKIKTPVVLVGHSLGSNIARRVATLFPADVAALVLVDPPAQHIAEFSPEWVKEEDAMSAQRFAFIDACTAGAEQGQLATTPPKELESCIHAADPAFSAELNAAIHASKARPAFWHTLKSQLQANQEEFAQPVSEKESHDAMPLVVLVADSTYADAPPEARKALEAAREKTQKSILATSKRAQKVPVAHSSHEMPLDRPDAISDAVARVIHASANATH